MRVVDYKTGRSPSEYFEAKALFQMRFYALVLWRMRGVVPTMLQLVYLGNGEVLRYSPDEHDLLGDRAQGQGALDGHRAGGHDRRLATVAVQAVRLVRPPRHLPRVGRHPAAAARAGLAARRRPRRDRSGRARGRVTGKARPVWS